MTDQQIHNARAVMRIIMAVFVMINSSLVAAEEIEIRGAKSIKIGDYTIRLDGSTTAWIDTTTNVIRFDKPVPDEPDPDPPEPGIGSLSLVAFEELGGLPLNQRIAIADVFGKMRIGPGLEVANESELGALTTERLRTVLGVDVNRARAKISNVFDAANKLRDAGKIVTIQDWAAAWAAIAKGVRP